MNDKNFDTCQRCEAETERLRSDFDRVILAATAMNADNAAVRAELDAANKDAAAILVALKLILDCVDYTSGSCGLTEMVGGALPAQIISKARAALASHEARINEALKGGEK